MKIATALAVVLSLLATRTLAAEGIPAVKELSGITPQQSVFTAASATKPLEIRSADEAAAHFGKDEVAKLTNEVDFTKQTVLVFAWRGSGQDKLSVAVAESSPEQVVFTLTRGRTKDLRPHVYIYAVRAGVTWSAK